MSGRRPPGWLSIGLVISCGFGCEGERLRLGDGPLQPDSESQDAGNQDAGGEDADAADSAGQSPFSPPIEIDLQTPPEAKDDDPTLSDDLTLLVFNRDAEDLTRQEDIWFSTRSAPGSSWATPQEISELNSEDRETGLALAPNGLALWFSSDRPGGAGGLDVYRSQRTSRDASWSAPERVAELSTEGDDLISAISNDLRTAYLARRADDDQDYALFLARRRDSEAAWEAAEALSALDVEGPETDASPSHDDLALVYTQDGDLMLARRASVDAPFQLERALDELNSEHDDRDAWLGGDLSSIVFSSDRSGSYRIYEASR